MTVTSRPVPTPASAAEPVPGPRHDATAAITASGLIAILRAPTAHHFPAITDALVRAGVRAIEVTLTTGGALSCLRALTAAYGDDIAIGAGTVLTADQADMCIEAGAGFLVSPVAAPDVVAAARIAGVPAYPGALTPTEIAAAHHAGAPAVKLFPASAASPRFITDVHGPLPDVSIIPTGGIALTDIPAWISAGAAAVGLGSPLSGAAGTDGVTKDLTVRARQALGFIAAARSTS
ncbi:bifunctional 4-hydroxy-2-oxoglutarate aldolase/2-dehydro-3-deoxy-phosphogluconate aldolase [Streptomyces sp. NPDC006458]|uniref:bifunctional 4-hydroxy-2-oxoglutarate aldolase/2-dehydro-3-deoxy-phosphogluconate aldolase n=1 Tax=Streptomyces sp. NPDC006458 TaxID=3154302 RepID=UPI00339E0161